MKKRALWIGCCMAALLIFSGCQDKKEEVVPASQDITSGDAVSENTASANISSQSQNVKPQGVKNTPGAQQGGGDRKVQTEVPAGTAQDTAAEAENPTEAAQEAITEDPAGAAQEFPTENPAGTAQAGEDLGQGIDEMADGEDMQQCPYCGEWFSTAPDGDLWDPYDRHVLEERETYQEEEGADGYQEDPEMVQCPDCGNWYEAGNVFRNHICEGR